MKHNWEYKRLGDVCTVVGGSTPRTDHPEFWGGSYSWFTPAELDDRKYYNESERKITPEAIKATGLTLMPKGTVLLSSRAPIGKVGIITSEAYCNQGFKNLICGSSILNEYLYHTLLYFNDQIKAKGKGSTFKEISKSATESFQIPVPPMEVQERIVAELDQINDLIATRKEQIKLLDSLAQSLFYDTFGDPITNTKGWEVSKYENLFNITSGGTPSTKIHEYWNNGTIPWIGSNLCNNSILYETDGKFITELGLDNSSAKVLPIGTTLIAMVGATIGKTAYSTIPLSTNQNVAAINVKDNSKLHPLFVYFHTNLLYPLFIEIGGDKFTIASLKFIKNLPLIIPPLSLQQQFASQVEAIEIQKKVLEESLQELQTLLASRMDYWFN